MKDFQMILELKDLLLDALKSNENYCGRPYNSHIVAGLTRVYKASAKTVEETLDNFLIEIVGAAAGLEGDEEKFLKSFGIKQFREVALYWISEAKKG